MTWGTVEGLRSCAFALRRSELSWEVFPLGVLEVCPTEFPASFSPSLHVFALSLELVSLSCALPTRSRRDVHEIRGLPKPYSTDESRVCTTLSDTISNLSTW